MTDDEDEEPIARWEALLLPEWTWEAFEKESEDRYYGRVKSPLTYDHWEWGYFTRDQLEDAGAYRVDTDIDDGELFPDGGSELADLYETEFNALHYIEPEDGDPEDG